MLVWETLFERLRLTGKRASRTTARMRWKTLNTGAKARANGTPWRETSTAI